MAAMKLVLLEEDCYFREMLAVFIRSTEYSELFMLQSFGSREAGYRYVESEKERYILIVHESFLPLPDVVFQRAAGWIVVLSEEQGCGGIKEYPSLFKYQPLDQLLSSVTGHYNEYSDSAPLAGNKQAQVIALFSAVAGTGKTVVTAHLARQLAQQGERVFCLTLEQLPSYAWYPGTERSPEGSVEAPFSELLYYAKSQPAQVPAKLEQLKRRHPRGKYEYLEPSLSWKELYEWSGQDVEVVVQSLLALGVYDRILLDLDSSLHPSCLRGMQLCDQVYWLLVDDAVHLEKAALFRDRLDELLLSAAGKSAPQRRYVLNKSIGPKRNDFAGKGFVLSGELPYVPEWKAVMGTEEQFSSRVAEAISLLAAGAKEVEPLVDR